MHRGQRQYFEELERLAAENGHAVSRGEAGRFPQVLHDALEVVLDLLLHCAGEADLRQRRLGPLHPVLQLDQILAPRPIAQFQLQVAGDDPMIVRLQPGETGESLGDLLVVHGLVRSLES
jgi:hypothetical protein